MKEYIHDFLSEFSMQVIGVNKDHVGVSVPTSEWEFAMQEVLDKQNRFVFKGRRFSNVEITPEQAVDFTLPDTFPRDRLQQPDLPEISEMPKFDPMQKNDPWKSRQDFRHENIQVGLLNWKCENARWKSF